MDEEYAEDVNTWMNRVRNNCRHPRNRFPGRLSCAIHECPRVDAKMNVQVSNRFRELTHCGTKPRMASEETAEILPEKKNDPEASTTRPKPVFTGTLEEASARKIDISGSSLCPIDYHHCRYGDKTPTETAKNKR